MRKEEERIKEIKAKAEKIKAAKVEARMQRIRRRQQCQAGCQRLLSEASTFGAARRFASTTICRAASTPGPAVSAKGVGTCAARRAASPPRIRGASIRDASTKGGSGHWPRPLLHQNAWPCKGAFQRIPLCPVRKLHQRRRCPSVGLLFQRLHLARRLSCWTVYCPVFPVVQTPPPCRQSLATRIRDAMQ